MVDINDVGYTFFFDDPLIAKIVAQGDQDIIDQCIAQQAHYHPITRTITFDKDVIITVDHNDNTITVRVAKTEITPIVIYRYAKTPLIDHIVYNRFLDVFYVGNKVGTISIGLRKFEDAAWVDGDPMHNFPNGFSYEDFEYAASNYWPRNPE